MYYFVYHVITIGLYWEEKVVLFKIWNYRFHNPQKKSYSASAIRLKMKKSVEPLQKQTMGVAFFSQNSQLLTFSLPTKEIFQLSVFVLSHEKYHYPGQRTNFRFFFSYFVSLPFLGNFEWHCLLEIRIFLVFFFSSHNSRKSRHATLDWERSTLCHSFINLTQLIVKLNTCKKLS